eukprot:1183207-Prorocentrum_minimum.AAC.3
MSSSGKRLVAQVVSSVGSLFSISSRRSGATRGSRGRACPHQVKRGSGGGQEGVRRGSGGRY